jgi:hypothetical protein
MNNLALAAAMATAPSTAFGELRERPRFWFPLLLVVLSIAAVVFWYYSIVDIEWLKDTVFSNTDRLQKLPEADRAKALAMIGRTTMLWGSVIGALVGLPIFFTLQSLYLLVAAKVTKLPQGFKHWFAFSCWTALPLLLGTVVSAILLLMSSSPQIPPGVLQALSINELLLHKPQGAPGQALFDSIGIPGVLSWVLAIIGIHNWSGRSWAFSSAFILLPVVVMYGIWAIVALR